MSYPGRRLFAGLQRQAAAVIALLTLSACSFGQLAPGAPFSAEIEQVRERQRQLAEQAEIAVVQSEDGRGSSSRLEGVPLEFRNLVIRNEMDAVGIAELLGPYYGFTGTESLELESVQRSTDETSYLFRQFIDEIETQRLLSVKVDDETSLITMFLGSLDIDTNLERFPPMDESKAIELVVEYIEEPGEIDANRYVLDGANFAEVIYRNWSEGQELRPGWRVFIERIGQNRTSTHDAFMVSPDGKVGVDGMVTI